jgi:uncharacterized protein (TIGR03067 family)
MKLALVALSLLVLAPFQAAQDDVKKELDKLKGDWLITTVNGQDIPTEAEAYLVFNGDKYEQWVNNAVNERGTITLDIKTKPMQMDMVITEGDDAGKRQLGLFEVTADALTLTMATPGETTRPTALNSGAINAVLKKTK